MSIKTLVKNFTGGLQMIKLKRLLAVILALSLVILPQIPAMAEGTGDVVSDAKICETLGMLIGEGNGLTSEYLAQTPTRIKAALLYLRLKGLDKEAMAYKGTSNFADAEKEKWAVNIMAYLKAHPELGMIGVGDNKFSPEVLIDAQGYYKILLEALGYKAGEDFKWEDTLSFAASKGLNKGGIKSKFTISDMATATVEALKATVNGGADTLAGTLVKSGGFTTAQVDFLKAVGISMASADFTVSVKSSTSFLLKFDKPIADVTKVGFSIYKDSALVGNLKGQWNTANTELTLSQSSKLEAGSYSISVTLDNASLGTKSATVEAERIESIKFIPKVAVLISDIKGEVSYRALNQYGEDVSNSLLMQNVHWSTNADSVTADVKNSKLVVTKNGTPGTSQLKDTKIVYITGYDANWKSSISEQVSVSDGFGLVKDIKFLGISNKNGKKEITVDTREKFYIDFEALDAEGNKVDNYTVLSNIATLGLYSNNPAIAAHVVRDPDNMTKALIEIDTHTASGVAEITGVALSTDKTASIKVEVKKGAVLSSFIVEPPSTGVPVNERVELPFKALDQNGNPLYGFDEINGKMIIISNDPLNAVVVGERAQDGKYVLTARFNEVKKYNIKIVIIESNTTSDFTVETKPAAVPTTLASINRDVVYGAIVENGQIWIDFVNNPGFKVLDQNDTEFNMKEINMVGSYYYYIHAISLDKLKVGLLSSDTIAYKDTGIKLVGGSIKGATTVTFELCRDTDLNPANGKEILDVKEVVINNIDRKEITQYEFASIPTLYANPDVKASDTYASVTKQKQQYAGNIKIVGKTASGDRVALSPYIGVGNNVLNLTVTDPSKFNIDLTNSKILAKSSGADNEASDKLTATIQGANGIILTVSTDVHSSKAVPVAQSIDVVLKNGSQVLRSGDSFTCKLTTFNASISGRELRKFDSAGNDAFNADIAFVIKDQYGNVGLTPSYFAITKTQGGGTVRIDPNTGLISGSALSGDQYIVTAVTNNGLTKAITINIQ